MKKTIFGIAVILGVVILVVPNASAHSGGRDLPQVSVADNTTTSSGTLEGEVISKKLRSKEFSCNSLNDGDFDKLGDYYVGQMADIMGKGHKSMDSMMESMMGADKSKDMRIVMGKRFSGCDTSAKFSMGDSGSTSMMSMMMKNMMGKNMMGNQQNSKNKSDGFMMGFGYGGHGAFGWLWMILWWGLVIIGIVALIRWINKKNNNNSDKSAVNILKERYAKGEITRHEFESMKKEIE